jgi:hypothetical protein
VFSLSIHSHPTPARRSHCAPAPYLASFVRVEVEAPANYAVSLRTPDLSLQSWGAGLPPACSYGVGGRPAIRVHSAATRVPSANPAAQKPCSELTVLCRCLFWNEKKCTPRAFCAQRHRSLASRCTGRVPHCSSDAGHTQRVADGGSTRWWRDERAGDITAPHSAPPRWPAAVLRGLHLMMLTQVGATPLLSDAVEDEVWETESRRQSRSPPDGGRQRAVQADPGAYPSTGI